MCSLLVELAYLEVRGLHIRGEGDVAKAKYPDAIGKPDPLTNGGGITADSRKEPNKSHHLRFADNLVEFCPGAGKTMPFSPFLDLADKPRDTPPTLGAYQH